jgi:hypothetical protein
MSESKHCWTVPEANAVIGQLSNALHLHVDRLILSAHHRLLSSNDEEMTLTIQLFTPSNLKFTPSFHSLFLKSLHRIISNFLVPADKRQTNADNHWPCSLQDVVDAELRDRLRPLLKSSEKIVSDLCLAYFEQIAQESGKLSWTVDDVVSCLVGSRVPNRFSF